MDNKEKLLRQSQEQFHLLIAGASNVMYHMSSDWTKMEYLLGKELLADTLEPTTEWIGKYILPDDQPKVLTAIRNCVKSKSVFDLKHRVKLADGLIGWVHSRAIPFLDEHGNIKEWFGFGTNITEPKSTEGTGGQFLASVFDDISELKQHEKLQQYLLKLNDNLRSIADPVEVEEKATALAMDYFSTDRCYYNSIEGPLAIVKRDARKTGLPSVAAIYQLNSFPLLQKVIEEGSPFVVHNIRHATNMDDSLKELCFKFGIISFVNVPIIKNGRAAGVLSLVQSTPRQWAELEIQAAVETAERTWSAVERAKAEDALRKSEEKYRSIFNSINEGFSLLDIQFDEQGEAVDVIIRDANEAQNRIDGVKAFIGKRVKEVLPNIEMKWIQRYGDIVKSGEPASFEDWSEANQRWYKVHASKIGDTDSTLVAIVYDDITVRKIAEEEHAFLLQLSDALGSISDPLQVEVLAANLLGEHMKANMVHYAETMGEYVYLKYSYTNGISAQTGKFPHYHFDEHVMRDYRNGKALVLNDRTTDTVISEEQRNVLKQANIASYIAAPLVKNKEWVATLLVENIEPTNWKPHEIELVTEVAERTWSAVERAKAEEARRESELKYRTLFNSLDDGYCIIEMLYDENGKAIDWRFIQVNDAFEKHIGLSNAVGKTIKEMVPDIEEKWIGIYDQIVQTGEPIRFEEDSTALQRIFNSYAFRIGNPHERKLAVIFTDVSEKKKAEETLIRSEGQLKRLLKMRDEFIAIASHELKTPITSMKTYAEIARENLQKNKDAVNGAILEKLNKQIDRLTALINDLLDTTKMAEGKLQLKFSPFNINELIHETVDELGKTTSHRFELKIESLQTVTGDRERIRQVISNLLSNAIKYSPRGTNICLSAKNMDKGVKIEVTDEGYGIPEEDQKKIFDRFYRVSSNQLSTFPGMGLGLYISMQIVQRHGGAMEVQSIPGKGSTFAFTLLPAESSR